MKVWLANLLWEALAIFLGKVHDWAFSADRAAKIRFAHRLRWYAYKLKAEKSANPKDDMRAEFWRINFAFETSPVEALQRGDLKGKDAAAATAAVQKYLDEDSRANQ